MSELKAFTFCLGQYTENGSPCVVAVDDEENPRLASDEKFYLKSEADKVIEELQEKHKTEAKELLCLIRDKENNFNRAFDSEEKENRRLKRALWLARAEWAKDAHRRYCRLALKEECDPQPHGWTCYINGEVYPTGKMSRKLEPHYWFDVWDIVERKCRAKAEEHK